MHELIESVKNGWASFRDWVDFDIWKKMDGRGDVLNSVVLVRFKDDCLCLTFVQQFLDRTRHIWFGNYLALIYEHESIGPIIFEITYNLKKMGMNIEDQDILFFSNHTLCEIQTIEDIVRKGRLILLEKEDNYTFTQIEKPDDKEFACLLYAANNYDHFGFEGLKRIIDIIEYRKSFEALYIVICSGLRSCYPSFNYILSYINYIYEHHNYLNLDILRLLLIHSSHNRELDRKVKVVETFSSELSLEDFRIDMVDMVWLTKKYLKV